jgi:formylglycine-generating enzyme required for sulfatase activity
MMKRYVPIVVAILGYAVISLSQGGRIRPAANQSTNQSTNRKTNQAGTHASPTTLVVDLHGVKMELVSIPPGSFQMGADKYDNEKPAHQVVISKAFFLGRYEVTQAQWRAVMGSNPSRFRGDRLPVEQVSWNDAQNFIQGLNRMNDGYTYRLPTEAEWEYACRAGTTGEYAGDLDSMAWDMFNSGMQTHPVGAKRTNAFGLYDMHGNVWEWCQDWYGENYYTASPNTDPQGPVAGQYRVLRGGSWVENAIAQRSATRYKNTPDYHIYGFIGFRVAAVRGK